MNMNDKGYTVVAFNRTVSKVDEFLNQAAKGSKVIGAHSIERDDGPFENPAKNNAHGKGGPAG